MAALNSQRQEDLALSAAYEDDTPTPSGWKRKLVPRVGKGLIPARTDVIFIAPDGEEFKSKAQLQRYLKANKGGPPISEFIWIVDETPRRSTRSTSMTPVKVMKVKSPPKAASKRKPTTEVPLEESKVGKRRHTEKVEIPVKEVKVAKGGKHTKKADKVAPIESKDEGRASAGSPLASRKKQRSTKDVKKTKSAQARKNSVKANGGTQMSKKDEHAKDETMEESISHEAGKEEPAKTNHSQGTELKGDKDEDTEDVMNETTEDVEGLEEVDGGDGTKARVLGSDPVAEVTEAQSETPESDEEVRALGDEANCHVEKAFSEGTAQDYETESMMHQENHLVEAAVGMAN